METGLKQAQLVFDMSRPHRENRPSIDYRKSSSQDEDHLSDNGIYMGCSDDNYSDTSSEDEFEVVTQIPQNRQRNSTGSTRPFNSTVCEDYKPISIPDIYQIVVPKKDVEFLNSDVELVGNPFKLFMFLFGHSINYMLELNKERFKDFIKSKMDTTTSNKPIVYSPLIIEDLYGFLGSLYLMDIYKLPQLKMYWA